LIDEVVEVKALRDDDVDEAANKVELSELGTEVDKVVDTDEIGIEVDRLADEDSDEIKGSIVELEDDAKELFIMEPLELVEIEGKINELEDRTEVLLEAGLLGLGAETAVRLLYIDNREEPPHYFENVSLSSNFDAKWLTHKLICVSQTG